MLIYQLFLGGGNLETLARIEMLERETSGLKTSVNSILNSKASEATAGLVKLSSSETVTESNGLALPTSEKNASVPGTLANKIQLLNQDKRISFRWGVPTPVSDNISNSVCQWQAFGGICMIYFHGIITMENMWDVKDIFTNCPKAIFGYLPWGFAQEQETCNTHVIGVNNEGTMNIRVDGVPKTGWYRGTITYPYEL